MNIRKKIAAVTAMVLAVTVVAGCGAKSSRVDETSVKRAYEVGNYVPDEAVALAMGTGDPALLAMANEALDLVNQERAAAGLPALSWSNGLAAAASVRASELPVLFSHTRPNGQDWYTVDGNIMFGENLAEFYNTPADVVAAWMASPTHRANIMDGEFTTCGIAIYRDGNDMYWAQEFGY